MTITTIERLSNELWIEIFQYLKIIDQCRAFSNLNLRLDRLIFSHQYQLTLNGARDELDYVMKNFLSQLKCRDRMKTLRLENLKNVDFSSKANLFEFPLLSTLILHRFALTEEFLAVLSKTTHHLQCVKVSPLISGNKSLLRQLQHLIFSQTELRFCSIRLGIALCPSPLRLTNSSSIEHLRLISYFETCSFDRLFLLLKYLPHLKTLHIVAEDIKWISTLPVEFIDFKCSITKFTLKVGQLAVPFNLWIEHLIRLTSYLEFVEIHSSVHVTELSYLSLSDWTKLFTSSPHLKQVQLEIHRDNNQLNGSTWKRLCNALVRLGKLQNASFSIVPQP